MSPLSLRSLTLLFACILSIAIAGQGRARPIAMEPQQVLGKMESSMAIVDGRPAVAWMVPLGNPLKYVRALDADGTEWGSPVTLLTAVPVFPLDAGQVVLRVVNGRPAVYYRLPGGTGMQFRRAKDATGAEWEAPVNFPDNYSWEFSMDVVNGKPAIVFYDGLSLKYLGALDADGAVWGSARPIVSSRDVIRPSLLEVQGRPAVSYCVHPAGTRFVRAADAAGESWQAPVLVSLQPAIGTSMQLVGGRPAILWERQNPAAMLYSRALDAEGTAWAPAVEVAANVKGRLAMVNGKPAAVLWTLSEAIVRYAAALDIDGTQWSPTVTVESAVSHAMPSLLEVSGRPAVVFPDKDLSLLKYVRQAEGGWPPELGVFSQDLELDYGSTVVVGTNIHVGATATVFLILRNMNEGSADLRIQSVTLEGSGAPEFRVSLASQTVPAGGSTTMEVTYAPVTGGSKSATLHINSNSETRTGPFELTLAGFSNPQMEVRRASGRAMPENSTFYLPSLPAGESADYPFTIANPGGADLTVSFTVGGTDKAEFSIVSPVSAVPPGGTAAFTLRHASTRSGEKSASLRITNNVPPLFDPFDLRISAGTGAPDVPFIANAALPIFVTAIALNGDSSILVATEAATLTKLHPDGTADPSFFPPVLAGGNLLCLAVLYDGKILIGGRFTSVNGRPRSHLARLEPDGSLDESFNAAVPDTAVVLAVQPDGRILAAGGLVAGAPFFVVRLLPDGAPDPAFASVTQDGQVTCLTLQDDGRLLAAGGFDTIGGVTIPGGLARLDSDGTAHAFGSLTGQPWVDCLAVHADGRVMSGGLFTQDFLALLQPDGTRAPISGLSRLGPDRILSIAVQADGKWLAGRNPTTLNGTGGASRLHSDGSFDDSFLPLAFSSGVRVTNVILQADGKVLTATDFPTVSNVLHTELGFRPGLLRLHNDPAVTTLQVEAPGTLRWRRGGTAPEVNGVLFQSRPDGAGEWTLLGKATRFPGGWELSGLTLPSTGRLRAVGRAGGSVMETVIPASDPLPSPLEAWRLQYFQTPDNTGDAVNDADPDKDGLTNFTEYAFGLSPVDRADSALPEFIHNGTFFSTTFTVPPGREDLLYGAEESPAMLPGTWTAIPNSGTPQQPRFTIPGNSARAFVRFIVKIR